MPRASRVPASLALVAAVVVAAPSSAIADTETRTERGLAWGGLTLEASMAGVFAINFGTRLVPNHGPGLLFNFTPMVLAPGIGWLMRDVDADPAYAVHGAAWVGFDLFLLGTLIDGRHERDRMKVGKTAWTLGALGAVAGGVLGATRLDDRDEGLRWMVAPPAGFIAGGIGLGTLLVFIGGLDGDKALSQWTTGAAVGLAAGLGFGTYYALRSQDGDAAPRVSTTPSVDPGGRRFMMSFGGRF